MNKLYIKRQLTLGKLGFPINKDVKSYDIFFKEIINIKTKVAEKNELFPNHLIFSYTYATIYYDQIHSTISINSDIWMKYNHMVNLNTTDTNILMISLFEYYLDIEIKQLTTY